MKWPLTTQEQACLSALAEMCSDGVGPSYEELRQRLGLSSKSDIHRLVGQLERKGFIRRLPNRSRAIEIVPQPKPAFAWPEGSSRVWRWTQNNGLERVANCENFRVITGRDAWTSFATWYGSTFRVTPVLAGRVRR